MVWNDAKAVRITSLGKACQTSWAHHAELGGAALHDVGNHIAGGHASVMVDVGNAKAAGLVPTEGAAVWG